MRWSLAAAAMLAGVAPAGAIECPLTQAVYGQPGGQVELRFTPVPRDGAANQIAAFRITIEGVEARFSGEMYVPNGFGQRHGVVGLDCTGADGEDCRFWEGVVYALGAEGIEEFPYDPNHEPEAQMAPRQVLLPEFAVEVWYSMLRGRAFEGDRNVLDTFTLVACAE